MYRSMARNMALFRGYWYTVPKSRLMYGSLRIAVAELLPFRDRWPEFWRSWFPRARHNEEEILLASCLRQTTTPLLIYLGLSCHSLHSWKCNSGARRYPIANGKYPRASVIRQTEAKSRCRWRLIEVALLQLQRRQGQVRHERC